MLASDLARLTEVTESTISRLLSGNRNPGLDLMLRIRDVLGWKLEDQADCLQLRIYPARLKLVMEAVPCALDSETAVSAVRSVQGAGTD